ncbi:MULTISPECIES: MarR family winged helix-turn-helix transcriptional regulator [Stappiaceae]|uniref:HTH marR-type domain-containing protein n=1 Tax=Roseibium aggregatum TaxID=187304 RepID=A0A0M6Y3U8_9HYPH|nr:MULTISPECIES: MarR family winged helix-turn-helix transcriptional regulator [Stappiaceae]QFT65433.1 hypothetical protein FIU93_01490 [Labrenzia sp. THAF35]CTQ44785.1 hypothetical protein LAL4801_03232 [Roseibium aggregatum]
MTISNQTDQSWDPAPTLSMVSYCKEMAPNMDLAKVAVLLHLANEPGCTSRYLTEKMDVNQSTISRIVGYLGRGDARSKYGGLGWVSSHPDPEDPRKHRHDLTSAGKAVVIQLLAQPHL